MFRAYSAHHQEVHDANCTYAASGIVTLCKWLSCATASSAVAFFERIPPIIRRSMTQIVHMQPLVSSHSASDCLVQPLPQRLHFLSAFCPSSGGSRRKLYICSLWYCHSLQVTVLCNCFLSGCTRQSLAERDDTRGCICTICIVDLLMMGGMRSKHVEDFN